MLAFTKMHGIGNDFVLLDARSGPPTGLPLEELARRLCDRKRGIGADGLILLAPGNEAPLAMRMWNPDGSESEMCGNGLRCLARFAVDLGAAEPGATTYETGAGVLATEVHSNGNVTVDMGSPKAMLSEGYQPVDLGFQGLKGIAVSMGNPHIVIFVPSVDAVPLEEWGPVLEHHRLFPNRTNVHFVQAVSPTELTMRTWERGAGITLACGTGSCAVAVAGYVSRQSLAESLVHLPGGDLHLKIKGTDEAPEAVSMSGPAQTVFVGTFDFGQF